ncbi:MAG: RimK family alpha-L-glutamate ligase, partial [Zoogloea sp.]|nr:RimK family alpha-L-glutamate ligase [Zoogloea sp.]
MNAVTDTSLRPPLLGLGALMRKAFAGESLGPLGTELVARATRDEDDAEALLDLSIVLQFGDKRDLALATQAQALAARRLYTLPAARQPAAIRLLVIKGPGDL